MITTSTSTDIDYAALAADACEAENVDLPFWVGDGVSAVSTAGETVFRAIGLDLVEMTVPHTREDGPETVRYWQWRFRAAASFVCAKAIADQASDWAENAAQELRHTCPPNERSDEIPSMFQLNPFF